MKNTSIEEINPSNTTKDYKLKDLDPHTKELANYIADMLLELRNMAKGAELNTLLGLLEVTFYEAFSIANRIEIPPKELEKLRELERAGRAR